MSSSFSVKEKHLQEGKEFQSAETFGTDVLLAHTRIDITLLCGVALLYHFIVTGFFIENDSTALFVITDRSMKAVIGKEKPNVSLRAINNSVVQ